jgi:hypothetical protein
MNCPNCGQPIEPNAAFCGNCGQPLATQTSRAQAAPVPANNLAPAQLFASTPSVISQGYANAQTPNTPISNTMATGAGLPNAALPIIARSGEATAIISMLISVLALPGGLIPYIGLSLGLIGVVLGSLTLKSSKHVLGMIGMIIGIIAIFFALGMWAYNASVIKKEQTAALNNQAAQNTPIATTTTTTGDQSVTTPCFSATFPASLSMTGSPSSCTLTARTQTEEYTVNATSSAAVTPANFMTIAKQSMESTAKNLNIAISSEQIGVFSGSPAFIMQGVYGANNEKTIAAMIYHPSPDGENMFVIEHVILNGTVDLNALGAEWQWH